VQFNRETFNKLLPELVKAKAIICDARGYPKAEHYFIPHLMKSDDTTRSWMQIPQIIYPDHHLFSSLRHPKVLQLGENVPDGIVI